MQAKSVRRSRLERNLAKAPTALLLIALATAFLIGGGSRSDITSLVILRPMAALIFGFAVWHAYKSDLTHARPLAIVFAFWLSLPLAQLIPLPPTAWQALPGRSLMVSGEVLLDFGRWRPLTLVPENTWNAFFSLLLPGAVFLLAISRPPKGSRNLLVVLLVAGTLSAVIAVLQSIGPYDGPLYFYAITNPEDAVGLFSNRNHQALFMACMFPVVAVYVAELRERHHMVSGRAATYVAIAVGIALLVLIVIAGSRAGLLFALLGISFALALKPEPRRGPKTQGRAKRNLLILTGALLVVLGLALFSTRATTLERFSSLAISDDVRFQVWGTVADMVATHFPFGSGLGTFPETYYIYEPEGALSLNYLNHAHNDWLEIAVTGGLPALALVAAWMLLIGRRAWRLIWGPATFTHQHQVIYGRLGLAIIALLLASSVVDYPLRVPSLACLFMVANVWVWNSGRSEAVPRPDSGNELGRANS